MFQMIRRLTPRLLLACCCLLWLAPACAAPEPGSRTILLVRHGEYDADPGADPRLGPGLSALGVAQAQLVGARLAAIPGGIDALHVSPLQRARDTAATIATALPRGDFDVLDDLAECTPPTRRAKIMEEERAQDLAACQAQLERVFAAWFKPSGGAARTELFVCHGNVIRYLVTRALGVDSKAWLEMSIGHASLSKILVRADGSMQVLSVGDVGHLPPNLQSGTSADPERSLAVPAGR
jgi:serine/threonine-protein phosphatase PGAM5